VLVCMLLTYDQEVLLKIPTGLLYDIHKFINTFSKKLNDIEEILNQNRIFVGR